VKNLSDVLSFLMSNRGIKSAELARKTSVAQPVVSRLITGATTNPQVLTIKPIADFFDVSFEQLLGISPLDVEKQFNSAQLNDLNNKVNSIKTIASALISILPALIEGYQKAISVNLIKEDVPADILPLFTLNMKNLLKTTDQIQELLWTMNNNKYQDSI
jgi:transcriptional regulator with XRE-family HTH domain